MTAQHIPIPDSAGWIEWKGGECPVRLTARVDVRLRNGAEAALDGEMAVDLDWSWDEGDANGLDIVVYRLSDRLADESPEARYKAEVGRVNRATDAEIGLASSKPLPMPPSFDPATVCKSPDPSAIAGAIDELEGVHSDLQASGLAWAGVCASTVKRVMADLNRFLGTEGRDDG